MRALTPLFMRYGVDAVFAGHDEMYEHSLIRDGVEHLPNGDGKTRPHELHVYDVGIAGDGLRGPAGSTAACCLTLGNRGGRSDGPAWRLAAPWELW